MWNVEDFPLYLLQFLTLFSHKYVFYFPPFFFKAMFKEKSKKSGGKPMRMVGKFRISRLLKILVKY